MNSRYVSRVNKLDALQLDAAIETILREQQSRLKHGFLGQKLLDYQKYLYLITNSTIWWYSVKSFHSTLGQQLLAMKYNSEQLSGKPTLAKHYALYVLIPQLYKMHSEGSIGLGESRLDKFLYIMETFYLITKVWIFFRFCNNGQRPSVTDNLLGIDLYSTEMKRTVSYRYMNRELIWNGFMEFLTYTIPLINWTKIKNQIRRPFQSSQVKRAVEPKFDHETLCSFCQERPTMPHHFGCGHIYCYYCLLGNLEADKGFTCIECGQKVGNSVHCLYQTI